MLGATFTLTVLPNGSVTAFSGRLATRAVEQTGRVPYPKSRAAHALTDWYPDVMAWAVEELPAVYVPNNLMVTGKMTGQLHLCRVFDVSEPGSLRASRVYLDAATGKLRFRHDLYCNLERRLYQRSISAANRLWQEGDSYPGNLSATQQEALTATAETYNLYRRTFGRDSYDGAGGRMNIIVDLSSSSCPNAFARNNQISMCSGVVSDDIVSHEWAHNYLTATNGLIYAFEGGAIHEAYADIFGEAVDLLNSRGTDTNDHLPRTTCGEDDNMRWFIAEDATAIDTILRDLWDPECKTDAGYLQSDLYVCPENPLGRSNIHDNSGPIRRAFTLLADGGTLNGDTIAGIGLTKALHIFYHASAVYFTPVTDYYALADALEQSATDLLNVNLPALTLIDLPTAASNDSIGPEDLAQLARAIRATQLRSPSNCPTRPTLAPDPPALCDQAALPAFQPLLIENWADSLGNWDTLAQPSFPQDWTNNTWRITHRLPDGRAGTGVIATNSNAGDCFTNKQSGTVSLSSPLIELPQGALDFLLSFDHYYATEANLDGGIVEYAVGSSAYEQIPDEAFIFNGYDGPLRSLGSDNPLAEQPAFHGADELSNSGSWGTSIVDLTALGLGGGDSLRLRWTFGQNGCEGWRGWYLDSIRVGYCRQALLPVSWRSFTASAGKNDITLHWETETENHNAGFYLERRTGSSDFQDIGFVPAGATYRYVDQHVVTGLTYYYRLRQVDIDGGFSYSSIVSATPPNRTDLRVFPNPTRNKLFVRTGLNESSARLYDTNGRLVAEVPLYTGSARFETTTIPTGIYFVRVGKVTRRVSVMR